MLGARNDDPRIDRNPAPACPPRYDVFISYSREDARRVAPIRDRLAALGLTVFLDVEGIDGGAEFTDILDHAVKNAGVVLALWTHEALERRWVRIESRIGLDRGTLVAAAIEPMRLADLPAEFYNVNVIDLADFQGDEGSPGWERLLRAIGRKIDLASLSPFRVAAPVVAPPASANAHRVLHSTGWKEAALATLLAFASLGGAWQGMNALASSGAVAETRLASAGPLVTLQREKRFTGIALRAWRGVLRMTA